MSLTTSNDEHEPNTDLQSILVHLFEDSEVIRRNLVPQLLTARENISASDVRNVLDESMNIIRGWSPELQAIFIAGHPRIGETRNLSVLSSSEQSAGTSAGTPTSPEVLQRLQHLNMCYEHVYPGLRYISFVNGRTRAAIAEEMEDKLGIARSLSPDQPQIESLAPIAANSPQWLAELGRALEDVGFIAKSRLEKLEQKESE
ncbi:Oxo-4-hydroxy-4-carboxy-5-ureidoimidazoline decarboxylase [Phlebopus sp. FC_14]|nr:Oxo-4-hydroxy-4-carboxy-5-ureidoimidazoline decarboxylase [Phlebopus sp. FC_14]